MSVTYSDTALDGLKDIREYLLARFSQREVDRFAEAIERFEATVLKQPAAFKASRRHPYIRHAVIHHRCILAYVLEGEVITVVDAWDTRQDR